jgi:D-lactate dehydrogenase
LTHESGCSWASFQKTHKHIVDGVVALSQRVKADEELTALINKKFSIKCTTGYSINALVGMCVGRQRWRGGA